MRFCKIQDGRTTVLNLTTTGETQGSSAWQEQVGGATGNILQHPVSAHFGAPGESRKKEQRSDGLASQLLPLTVNFRKAYPRPEILTNFTLFFS